ncbi:hypothetical protein tb265_29680 [Gemmatimonadetes bacterium T265]|nr:hypothetical protein tb265_29680 [Gemmatimonadetes bacterium T265]
MRDATRDATSCPRPRTGSGAGRRPGRALVRNLRRRQTPAPRSYATTPHDVSHARPAAFALLPAAAGSRPPTRASTTTGVGTAGGVRTYGNGEQ